MDYCVNLPIVEDTLFMRSWTGRVTSLRSSPLELNNTKGKGSQSLSLQRSMDEQLGVNKAELSY